MRTKFKIEYLLYALAFLLALTIRLVGIGQLPLTDLEAELALQPLALTQGQSPLLGPHALYLVLTTLWMYIFSATNWVARFWPALAGSLLVLLPIFFRYRLGRFPAVVLAFCLAFDPGLLAVSRQADSLSLALFFALLAFGLWLNRRPALSGAAAGLALLSGPAIWPGLLGLGIAIWLAGGVRRRPPEGAPEESAAQPGAQVYETPETLAPEMRRFLISAVMVVLFAGTLFFFIPNGLSAAGQSIPVYLGGWTAGNGIPAGLFMLGLLLYEFLPLILGLWGGLIGWSHRSTVDRFLLIWWFIALMLALLYPGRQLSDLGWSLLPLWALAARQVTRLVRMPAYDRLPVAGQALLAAILVGFISMVAVSIVNAPAADPLENQVRLVGAFVMLVASVGLIAWGWSRQVALRGLAWGVGVILILYFLSSGWNAVGLAGRDGEELWSSGAKVKGANLLLTTLHNLDQWGPATPNGPDIVVMEVSSPALRWLLRNEEKVTYASALSSSSDPGVVITPLKQELALAATYRGEGFILGESVDWGQLQRPADWLRWLAFRTVPGQAVVQDRIILWARSDLFPGGAVQAGSKTPAQPQPQQSNP